MRISETDELPFVLTADNPQMAVVIALYVRRQFAHSEQDVIVGGREVHYRKSIHGRQRAMLEGFIDGLRWAVCGCK